MAPFSNVTFTSSFLTSGSSALITYSLSVSVMLATVVHSTPSPSKCRSDRPKNGARSRNISPRSRKGSPRVMFIGFLVSDLRAFSIRRNDQLSHSEALLPLVEGARCSGVHRRSDAYGTSLIESGLDAHMMQP